MAKSEFEQALDKQVLKSVPARSVQLYHGGVITLASLAIGLTYFQFYTLPSDVKPEDINFLRFGLGTSLGVFLTVLGMFCYFGWNIFRLRRAIREARAETTDNHE